MDNQKSITLKILCCTTCDKKFDKNEVIEDPQKLAEVFNVFFKSKVEDLANKLIKDPELDRLATVKTM